MNLAPPSSKASPRHLLGVVALVFGLLAPLAHADEYKDVNQLLRAGKHAEALNKADSYLATKPRDPQMRFLKGVILTEADRPADAIVTYVKLTEEYPELPEPFNNLAALYASQGQYDKARAALEMAIRTNPGYATAHENLGDVYAKLASQAYNKALQLDSNNASVRPKLAIIRELFLTPAAKGPRPSAFPATTASGTAKSGSGSNVASPNALATPETPQGKKEVQPGFVGSGAVTAQPGSVAPGKRP